ncbi:flagellar biosynthetic protein FlhB [Alteribacillus persepolensis]|uniref:Flagellar biosynthetic protein FlhB n=1 Tax=Alteribacillus persepolensis TaxID=568899 RepID=A0A1G7YPL3_9BACI|nr:flagellar biosynthesis protein FlhB [Alteribacillus persepolensis]SDG98377.1 flagellar biosynthetic protein FlhB [Alteribacillus persepolensis]
MKQRIDLQFFAQEKTEKATPKKRQDTRKKGQVPKSTDVNTALILLAVFLFLFLYGKVLGNHLFSTMEHVYKEYILQDVTEHAIPAMFKELTMESVLVMLPILLIALIVGMGASMLQVGFMFTPEAIKFKLEKINPLKGLKRIFSLRALVEFLKSMLKITLVGLLASSIIWFSLDSLMLLSLKSVQDGFFEVARLTGIIGALTACLLLFLSIPDYIYQKYDHEKQIRMSKQDVKDEQKKMEGDPQIKSKRKQKQMDMAMQRMMQEVPEADVVITNPTHFAIALRYDEENMDAPVITAKGADFIAYRIKTAAKQNEVVLVENKPLARALYYQTDIGDKVPEELFKATAEVLAYVYRLKNKLV